MTPEYLREARRALRFSQLSFFLSLVSLVLSLAVCIFEAHAAEPRAFCNWDISYYLLGEKHRSQSSHAWLLTSEQQAQLFGPFVAGHVYVEPGKAHFTCDGKKTEILTVPLAQGSLLLLKEPSR